MIRLANAQVWVHDQDEALDFYTKKLGMEVRSDVTLPEMDNFRWLTVSPPSQPGECDVCGGELYQRTDDTREVVANRVEVYLRDTLPVVERYARQGILQRVDGDQAIEAVQAAMLQAIGAAIPA